MEGHISLKKKKKVLIFIECIKYLSLTGISFHVIKSLNLFMFWKYSVWPLVYACDVSVSVYSFFGRWGKHYFQSWSPQWPSVVQRKVVSFQYLHNLHSSSCIETVLGPVFVFLIVLIGSWWFLQFTFPVKAWTGPFIKVNIRDLITGREKKLEMYNI